MTKRRGYGLGPRLRRWQKLPTPVRRHLRVARQAARCFAGRSSLIYSLYHRIAEEPHRRLQWVQPETALVIEGFGGSGNTVLYEVASQLCRPDLRIAHHLHISNQIDRAVEFDVPAIITVRPALDAITSLVRRGYIESPPLALRQYIDIHRSVLRSIDSIAVVTFDEVVQNPYATLRSAMELLGCQALVEVAPDVAESVRDSYSVDTSDTGTDLYFPPDLQTMTKAEAAALVDRTIGDDLDVANELYRQILDQRRTG